MKWVVPDRIAIVPGVAYDERRCCRRDARARKCRSSAPLPRAGPAGRAHLPPGTHNKWISLEDGRIASFRTVMTGELFNLLREHSILADLLAAGRASTTRFEAGVRTGLEGDALTAELFSVRARVLLGKARREDAASYTSGLLIGSDIRTGLARRPAGTRWS
jgi:2-dehydro-3-deoxygalactonokinase